MSRALYMTQVTEESLYHKNRMTPYMGMELYGQVETTIVGGQIAYSSYDGLTGNMNGQIFLD